MKTITQHPSIQTTSTKMIPFDKVQSVLLKLSVQHPDLQTDIELSLQELNKPDVFEKENNSASILDSIDQYGTSQLSELIAEEEKDKVKELASKVFNLKTAELSYGDILIQIFDKIKHTKNIDTMVVDTLYAETENQLSLMGQNLDQLHDIHNG